jgi:hypothetical protein
MKTLLMHAVAFGFFLFGLAVYNVAYTISRVLLNKDDIRTEHLVNNIGYMIYVTSFFIS